MVSITFANKEEEAEKDMIPTRFLKINFSGSYTIEVDDFHEVVSDAACNQYYDHDNDRMIDVDVDVPEEEEFRVLPVGQLANLISRISRETKGHVSAQHFVHPDLQDWDTLEVSIDEAPHEDEDA